jgi:hypothetical protein
METRLAKVSETKASSLRMLHEMWRLDEIKTERNKGLQK